MRGKELLTAEQRDEFMQIPQNIGERELGIYFTLSEYDIEVINRHRRDHNRLGFAVHLCLLRYPGWPITAIPSVPDTVLSYIAKQLQIDPEVFSMYGTRVNTIWDHLTEIRREYGYQDFTAQVYINQARELLQSAIENDNTMYLIRSALDGLRAKKIILPVMTTIERLVWEIRRRSDRRIFRRLIQDLSPEQKQRLDLLITAPNEQRLTPLAWLREDPGQSSPDSFLKTIERIKYIRQIGISIDQDAVHPRRVRQLARLGSRYEARAIRRFEEPKRYAILVAYLWELGQDLIDQAIEIHDRQMMILQSKGRKAQEDLQRQNGKFLNEKIVHFVNLGTAIIEARQTGFDLSQAIEGVMTWEKLAKSIEEAKQLARPANFDYLDLIKNRFTYLRRYTPALLEELDFRSTKAAEPVLQALGTLREMNHTGKRRVPDDVPLDFIPKRWINHVIEKEGNINRAYYEMAALTELRNLIRSGDVSVVGSRRHKDFDEYLVTKKEWKESRATTRLAVNESAQHYLEERHASLQKRLEWLASNAGAIEGVNLEKGRIQVDRLEGNTPEEAESLSRSLYAMLPRVKLTDLLMEVASWTEFDQQFTHASMGHPPKGEEKKVLLATLMAMGTNIGLTKMAEATPGVSYKQMTNAAQWRMYDDAMNRAQATLVNFQHRLALAFYWGDGSTSSSDGMRVQVGVSSLHADSNPHYGHGKGATIYRFVSDQFSSFYTKVINTNARDAIHVIDGILHHETDLNIEEHYTDTAGYTDQVFGLSHLLGFRFAPRLRDLSDALLYSIDKESKFPKLESLLRGRISTKLIEDNYDDVLRVAHSIREGKVSGSLLMGKLGSYARQNQLAKALREMGRIEKTIFLIDYISSEQLRRRIQRGLNKGEAMNALARAIFFGKRGEMRERALNDQLQRASALNILINAISVWNTVYLSRAVDVLKNTGSLREDLLGHISPLGWEHINFLGEYSFDTPIQHSLDTLRPLNI